jgi:hypothetical protein
MNRYLLALLFTLLLFAGPAFAQELDPLAAVLGPLLESVGVPGAVVAVIVVVITILRAAAATISKHIPDATLGTWAPIINKIGGNEKHAANAD